MWEHQIARLQFVFFPNICYQDEIKEIIAASCKIEEL